MVPGFCQFGEEAIIAPVFEGMGRRGMVVDVGAADGVFLSHSRGMLLAGWFGILIDPLPLHVEALNRLYADNPRVTVRWGAVSKTERMFDLLPALDDPFNSTLVPDWKTVAEQNGERYGEPIKVYAQPLSQILDDCGCTHVDFLTVDAELMDLEVLQSLDWARWNPRLVCAESGRATGPMHDFMVSVGYRYLAHTKGNTFWLYNSK